MEKKLTKNEKGITLVALIITIIILLILAVVSIRAITGDNILGKSETAKEKYESAKKDETDRLGDYSNEIKINENNKSIESNVYYREEVDGMEVIYKVGNGKLVYYFRKIGSEEKYKMQEEFTIINVSTKVKRSDNIHHYNKVGVTEVTNTDNYQSDDIVINGTHYSVGDIILISDTEIYIDPRPWYYEEKDEAEMEQTDNNSIASLVENFDESLLSDEIFEG